VAAQILVVQTEPDFLDQIVVALSYAGHTVHPYLDPMGALDALESLTHVDLLITRVRFGEGNPHGIALARMAHTKRRGIKVIFTARQEFADEAAGLGEFMIAPVSVSDLEQTVERLLKSDDG
jgi:two-component SAPR family response regulator